MVLTAKESIAGGSALLSTITTGAFAATSSDDLVAGLADAVFEGDRGAAKMWAAAGLLLSGLALGSLAVFGPLNGTRGFGSLSFGATFIGLAAYTALDGGA